MTLSHPNTYLNPQIKNKSDYPHLFVTAMHKAGVFFNGEIDADGRIHRFAPDGNRSKDGWYVFYGYAGAFGDWKKDIHQKWNLRNEDVPGLDKSEIFRQIEKSKDALDEEAFQREQEKFLNAMDAVIKWYSFSKKGESPYLVRKGVQSFGGKFKGSFFILPLRDAAGKIWSLQWIGATGRKKFFTGGRKKGCFHTLGTLKDGHPILVCEGYATGASLYMATQKATVVAFDALNLEPVVEVLKVTYPQSQIIVAGDDDQWNEVNVGRMKAKEVALQQGCKVIFPQFKKKETKPTDFNDLHLLEGLEEVNQQLLPMFQDSSLKAFSVSALLSKNIPPREMLLGPILPEQGLAMIHAPRGIGKTHMSLLIAYSVANGKSMFQERWVAPQPRQVLFVDGEMPLAVMKERLHKITSSQKEQDLNLDNLKIITPDLQNQGISDLSTREGQDTIEEHLSGVKLLILDNYSSLCRRGRENEAESWIPLQEWFLTLRRRGLSVLLVHHSNKTGGQRGTSRKEDLLDTILCLRKPKDYDPSQGARFEVHYEKARGFYGKDAVPFEAWLKEENKQFAWNINKVEDSIMDKIIILSEEGLSQREIAVEMGISPATVNRRLKDQIERKIITDKIETTVSPFQPHTLKQ